MIDERYEEVSMQINWECFSTYNHDSRGIRFKFEDLCRQLFINEFIKDNRSVDVIPELFLDFYKLYLKFDDYCLLAK